MKIFLVADDPLVRDALSAALKENEHEVVCSAAAEPALSKAMLSVKPISEWVIDIDLGQGEMDGRALAEQVRRLWPQAGIIYVTGNPLLLDGRPMTDRERVCIKPCDIGQLTSLLDELAGAASALP